jgi:hypothetical protein
VTAVDAPPPRLTPAQQRRRSTRRFLVLVVAAVVLGSLGVIASWEWGWWALTAETVIFVVLLVWQATADAADRRRVDWSAS